MAGAEEKKESGEGAPSADKAGGAGAVTGKEDGEGGTGVSGVVAPKGIEEVSARGGGRRRHGGMGQEGVLTLLCGSFVLCRLGLLNRRREQKQNNPAAPL